MEDGVVIDQERFGKVIKECVKTRRSGMDMLSKLDFVEMLQELMFEEHDKVLLPLLILRLKEKQINQKAQKAKNCKNRALCVSKKKIEAFNNNHSPGEKDQLESHREPLQTQTNILKNDTSAQNYKKEQKGEQIQPKNISGEAKTMSHHKAYKTLLNSKPNSPLKKAVRKLMLENIKPFFSQPMKPLEPKLKIRNVSEPIPVEVLNTEMEGLGDNPEKHFEVDDRVREGSVIKRSQFGASQHPQVFRLREGSSGPGMANLSLRSLNRSRSHRKNSKGRVAVARSHRVIDREIRSEDGVKGWNRSNLEPCQPNSFSPFV